MEWEYNFSWTGFDEWKCAFVHVPKTGGISVSHALFGCLVGHHQASEYDEKKDYFRFAFVRDPFDRLISAYEWYFHPDRNDGDREWRARHIDPFPSFASWVMRGLDSCLHVEHFRPQSYWIDRPMHFIGRYEHLAEGVRYVQACLGMPATPLGHMNKSQRRGSYWTQEAWEKARDVYRPDFDGFGY